MFGNVWFTLTAGNRTGLKDRKWKTYFNQEKQLPPLLFTAFYENV